MEYTWDHLEYSSVAIKEDSCMPLKEDKAAETGKSLLAMVMWKPSVKGYWAAYQPSKEEHLFLTPSGKLVSELSSKDYWSNRQDAVQALDNLLKKEAKV